MKAKNTKLRQKQLITKATPNSITVSYYENGRYRSVRIEGEWRVKNNKLIFTALAGQEGDEFKKIELRGKWYLNRDNYLVFSYEGIRGKFEIVFKGDFVLLTDKRIVYQLSGNNDTFELKASLIGKLNLKNKAISYKVITKGREGVYSSVVAIGGRFTLLPNGNEIAFEVVRQKGKKNIVRFEVKKRIEKGKYVYLQVSCGGTKAFEVGLEKKDWRVFLEGEKTQQGKNLKIGFRKRF